MMTYTKGLIQGWKEDCPEGAPPRAQIKGGA